MITYRDLKKDFEQKVEELKNNCKHTKLHIKDDLSCCGAGSIFAKIIITCKCCNETWYIFRGSKWVYKTSNKIKHIIKHMIQNNFGRCWLKDEFQDNKIRYESRDL